VKVEVDSTGANDYRGVHAKLRTTQTTGMPLQRFTFVIQIGNVSLEIEGKDAVNLSEDLMNCVSDAHDPTSEMRKRWAERITDNGDGTVSFNV